MMICDSSSSWRLLPLVFLLAAGCADEPASNRLPTWKQIYCACDISGWTFDECEWLVQFELAAYGAVSVFPEEEECLSAARTCVEIETCLFGESPSTCDGSAQQTCLGPEVRSCLGDKWMTYSCQRDGEECLLDDYGYGVCGESECSGDSYCDGEELVECISGVQRTVTCSLEMPGSVCGVDTFGAACVGTGAACTSADAECVGEEAHTCLGGRLQPTADCSRIGPAWECAVGACVPKAGRCPDPPHCDGDNLMHCGPEGSTVIDCAEIGRTRCDMDGGDGPFCV